MKLINTDENQADQAAARPEVPDQVASICWTMPGEQYDVLVRRLRPNKYVVAVYESDARRLRLLGMAIQMALAGEVQP